MAHDEASEPLMATAGRSEGSEGASQERLCARHQQKVFKCGRHSYPISILFIVGNEFCERFSYYGMKAILIIYFTRYLMINEHTSTGLYHAFTMLCYFSPLLGAVVADGWLGRYRTILYVSILYAFGNVLMALTAIPPAEVAGPLIALFIIALGTGGIKPCVSAFGGDQFLPSQDKELSIFFSVFYFAINGGSLLSTFITPILRAEVQCFGYSSCYPLAFGVPALLMIAALALFACGRQMYRQAPPSGNVVGRFIMATGRALRNRMRGAGSKREHWLHYADDKYEMSFLQDMRAVYQVLFLFVPLPFFWALFDQQGSRWTIQASKMDGRVTDTWHIQPDQVQILNPVLILLLIPLFDSVIYPLMNKLKIPNRPLQRMVAGMFLAVLAFLAAGILELKMKDAEAVKLTIPASPRLAIFNGATCPVRVAGLDELVTLDPLHASPWIPAKAGDHNLTISGDCIATKHWLVTAKHNTFHVIGLASASGSNISSAVSSDSIKADLWPQVYSGLAQDMDTSRSAANASGTVRLSVSPIELPEQTNVSTIMQLRNSGSGSSYEFSIPSGSPDNLTVYSVAPGSYDVHLIRNEHVQQLTSSPLKLVGSTHILIYPANNSNMMTVLTLPSTSTSVEGMTKIPIALQIPQYVLISMGEVLFSITGLSFSYSQAPASMKSVLTAAWLLTVAVGNLIVVAIAEAALLQQFAEFFLFAGLLFVDTCIFALMAASYKYAAVPSMEADDSGEGQSNLGLDMEVMPESHQ